MTITNRHVIILNSKDRSGESKSKYDCVFYLNDYYLHNAKHTKFKSISLTNLIYNVIATNNVLNYESGGAQNIIIPVGYYSSTTLATAINGLQAHFVVTDNVATKRFDFTSVGNTRIYAVSTIGPVIGVTTDTALATSYSGDIVYDFVKTYYINILSSALSNNDSVITSHNNNKYSVIASVPIDVGYGFLKYHDTSDRQTADYADFNSNQNVSRIDIRLVDDKFQEIDLQGSDWVASFSIYT